MASLLICCVGKFIFRNDTGTALYIFVLFCVSTVVDGSQIESIYFILLHIAAFCGNTQENINGKRTQFPLWVFERQWEKS